MSVKHATARIPVIRRFTRRPNEGEPQPAQAEIVTTQRGARELFLYLPDEPSDERERTGRGKDESVRIVLDRDFSPVFFVRADNEGSARAEVERWIADYSLVPSAAPGIGQVTGGHWQWKADPDGDAWACWLMPDESGPGSFHAFLMRPSW